MQLSFTIGRRWTSAVAAACACAIAPAAIGAVQDKAAKKAKPTVTLRASPVVGFAPARFVLTAEITGGADDYEEFYCAAVEWDWGDDTKTENQQDCDPYEPGKSEIKRRFVTDHTFNIPGEFRVQFRLKQKKKTVGAASTDVKVRCGVQDSGDCR
jgi:hypothetical protein